MERLRECARIALDGLNPLSCTIGALVMPTNSLVIERPTAGAVSFGFAFLLLLLSVLLLGARGSMI